MRRAVHVTPRGEERELNTSAGGYESHLADHPRNISRTSFVHKSCALAGRRRKLSFVKQRFTARVGGVLAVALGTLPTAALALPDYTALVPNGATFVCSTCHINPAGAGDRNSFGLDVEARAANMTFTWADLVALDSDNDGQTNGQELGDPCGTWQPGQNAPRPLELSRPGDAASVSADPDTPSCGGPDAGLPDLAVGDVGTSTLPRIIMSGAEELSETVVGSCRGSPGGAGFEGLFLLVGGGIWWRQRRRALRERRPARP